MSKPKLRESMRAARRALSDDERRVASAELCRRLVATPWYRDSDTVAAYLPFDGEIDPGPLIDAALEQGKRVCLPVLAGRGILRFAVFDRGAPLRPNRHGIPEPAAAGREFVEPRALDLVLAPVVAFDAQGHRIGMGAGYYDRAFSFLAAEPQPKRPLLIGAAYEMQRTQHIEADPWDVRLCGIATDRAVYELRRHGAVP